MVNFETINLHTNVKSQVHASGRQGNLVVIYQDKWAFLKPGL